MQHRITGVTVGRGTTVEFTFEDASKFIRTFDVPRRYVTNSVLRKDGAFWVMSNGDTYTADELYE